MHPDFKQLWSAFNLHNVKYLLVATYAVSIHAQPRGTKDLDILLKGTGKTRPAAYEALARFGAPVGGFTSADFRAGFLLSEISGVEFDAAWERRIEDILYADTGSRAYFISRQDLIAAKLASGRLQDLADVEAQRRLRRAKD
jgi:hypothetical protein